MWCSQQTYSYFEILPGWREYKKVLHIGVYKNGSWTIKTKAHGYTVALCSIPWPCRSREESRCLLYSVLIPVWWRLCNVSFCIREQMALTAWWQSSPPPSRVKIKVTSPDSNMWKTTFLYMQEPSRTFVDVSPSFELPYKVTFLWIVLSILYFIMEYLFKILIIFCLSL